MAVIINQFSVKLVKEKSARYDLETKTIDSPRRAVEIIETVLDLQHEAQEKFGIIPTPSQQDVGMTARIAEAGELLGIKVFDHIIVGFSGWVSMKERGLF